MSEQHPGRIEPTLDITPPTVELKLTGSPIPDPNARGKNYDVELLLSRKMTEFERDVVGRRNTNAGIVEAHDIHYDRLKLVNSSVELVRSWVDELKQVVKAIETAGERDRAGSQRSVEEVQRKSEEAKAEQARREQLASEVSFDD